jgi:type II secretory ATPase GspE/PulE/Tfp pilus assembly ATPase PilB-like protein
MDNLTTKRGDASEVLREDGFGSLDQPGASVLSRSGVYEGSSEERNLLCFLSDGRLLIADGQEMNLHVLSYRARLDRLKRTYRIQSTDIETIRKYYQVGEVDYGGRHAEHSMMQVTAKDLIGRGCNARASDIHIRVKKKSTEIYFRIHNDLIKVSGQTRDYGERLVATIYGAMSSVSDSSYKPTERQDASIADRDKLPSGLNGVRIATAPTSDGVVMVLRLLYNDSANNVDLEPLGFSPEQAAMLQQLKEQPIGLNIISGPTGSGKSTTLQRVLSGEILEAEGKIHVLTIEDPVEYPINGAVQTAITNAGSEEERSHRFSASIANAMRLDPDTIMIGEMRDRASAQNALRASMTGHQVWTTVHANSALAIVDRLVDLGLPMSLVADPMIVTGLISQRLVKLLCLHCRIPLSENQDQLNAMALSRVKQSVHVNFDKVCLVGKGCSHCRNQGTNGRSVLAEVILPDAQFFDYIRVGEKSKAMDYWFTELQGKTLLDHAIEKVAQGIVDPRMAEKVVGHLNLGARLAAKRLTIVEATHGT